MGTITTDTFNPIRAYSNVRLQQGVPLVDADVNELDDIRKFALRSFLKFHVGNGLRVGGDGFHILPLAAPSPTDLLISSGTGTRLSATNATYVQPVNTSADNNGIPTNPPVTVGVPQTAGIFSVGQWVVILQSNDGLFAGVYRVMGVPDGTHISVARAQNAPGVSSTTTVTTGAFVFLADPSVTDTGLNKVGRILVDGLDVIIPCDRLFSEQRISPTDLGAPYNVPPFSTTPPTIPSGTQVLVFLDMWERNISTLEDPSLIVQPLNTESCVRTKRQWVVRARTGTSVPVQGNPDFAPGHLYYPLASINRAGANDPITAATITDLREQGTLVGTIEQPSLPSNGGLRLLFDCGATGFGGSHLRIYADIFSIWFILNASWNGSAWVPDDNGWWTGGFRFSMFEFALFNNDPGATTISNFSRTWSMALTGGSNASFQTTGNVEETGHLGFETTGNPGYFLGTAGGGTVTFRNPFSSTPTSITLSPGDSRNVTGNPTVYFPDSDGFLFYSYNNVGQGQPIYWLGSYTASP
jgi:hypothetical protein